MRAVLMQDEKLRVAEVPEPTPGPGEVLVDVLACGICGSDLHAMHHGEDLNATTKAVVGFEMMDLSKPLVFGHEFVGRVASYGPNTEQKIPVGRRVVSMPILAREAPVFLGFQGPDAPGAYAEKMLLSEPLLIEVPDEMSTELAALTEPMAVAYRAVGHAGLGADDVPLVVGCGPIGLAIIAVLKMKGVGPIVAADFSPERRELAQRLGADVVVDPAQSSPYEAFIAAAATDDPARMAPPTGMLGQMPFRRTVAFECVGVPNLIQQIIAGVPAGSTIVVVGVNMESDAFMPAQCMMKELDLQFSAYYTPQEFAETFALLAAGKIDAAPLLTGTVGLDGIADAFERLANNPHDAKIIVDPSL